MAGISGETAEKIMVVDDEPDIVYLIKNIFQNEGYLVVGALTGRECLDKAQTEKPDLILLDIMMPDLDGYQVCIQIKNNPLTKDIPVIFVSTKKDELDIVKAIEMGGTDYFTKPFKKQLLLAKARKILKESKNRQQMGSKLKSLEKKYVDLEERYIEIQSEFNKLEGQDPEVLAQEKSRVINAFNESILIEYSPRDEHIEVISNYLKEELSEDKKVVLLTSQPKTNKFSKNFSTEIRENRLKVIDVTNTKPNGKKKYLIQLYLPEVIHYGVIWNYIPKNSILVFTLLSDILVKYGVKTTYYFVKSAAERLEKRQIPFIVTLNKYSHEDDIVYGMENLFSSIYEISEGSLKKIA